MTTLALDFTDRTYVRTYARQCSRLIRLTPLCVRAFGLWPYSTKINMLIICISADLIAVKFSGVHNIEYVHGTFYVLSK